MNELKIRTAHDLFLNLASSGYRLITGLFYFHSPGHWYSELDNFLRMRATGEASAPGYFLFLPNRPQCHTIQKLYGHHFSAVVIDDRLWDMACHVSQIAPDVTLHIGLSHARYATDRRDIAVIGDYRGRLVYTLPNSVYEDINHIYYSRRVRTSGYVPLAAVPPMPELLAEFLGYRRERMAVLQIKTTATNATEVTTDPSTYLPTIALLRDHGYHPVLIGREKMPEEFRAFDVLDYGNSPMASFENDIYVLKDAKFGLFGGSGLTFWGEISGCPHIYSNYWHIERPMTAEYCLNLPCMVRERASGRLLTFKEYYAMFDRIMDDRSYVATFPNDTHECVNSDATDLVGAVQEALTWADAPRPPMSARQRALVDMNPGGGMNIARPYVSDALLTRYHDLL